MILEYLILGILVATVLDRNANGLLRLASLVLAVVYAATLRII